jgi:hypothetical protein
MKAFLKSFVIAALAWLALLPMARTQTLINDVSVKTYGATGNGATDDTAAFQAAIAAAQASQTNNGIYVPCSFGITTNRPSSCRTRPACMASRLIMTRVRPAVPWRPPSACKARA